MKGHIRQRRRHTWELDPATGRRVTCYRTIQGAKRDTQRELRNVLTAAEDRTLADPGKLTVGAWLQQRLDEAQHSVAPKALQR